MLAPFGLSWVIQGLRGRSRHEGLFYWLLGRLIRLGPAVGPFVPALSLAGLLVASLTDDRKGRAITRGRRVQRASPAELRRRAEPPSSGAERR